MWRVSRVMIPSVRGSMSHFTAVVEWAGTHLSKIHLFNCQFHVIRKPDPNTVNHKQEVLNEMHYPSGTVLCNHRCVRAGLLSATISAAETMRSLNNRVGFIPITLSIRRTGGRSILRSGLSGDVFSFSFSSLLPSTMKDFCLLKFEAIGESIIGAGNDTIDNGEFAKELGARSVRFISWEVRFVACTVTTWTNTTLQNIRRNEQVQETSASKVWCS